MPINLNKYAQALIKYDTGHVCALSILCSGIWWSMLLATLRDRAAQFVFTDNFQKNIIKDKRYYNLC